MLKRWCLTGLLVAHGAGADNGIPVQVPQLPQRQATAAAPVAQAAHTATAAPSGTAQQATYQPPPAAARPDAALAATPATTVQRSQATGLCRLDAAPDRQNLSLLGADALPRKHVPLGEFRVQQLLHSPDGRWSLALLKLRGRAQHALMTFDLSRCESQATVELEGLPEDARFEVDAALLRVAGRELRIPLIDRSQR